MAATSDNTRTTDPKNTEYTEHTKDTKEKQGRCHYFASGRCRFGKDCKYFHDFSSPKKYKLVYVCKYHLTTGCTRRETCTFAHPKNPCLFFNTPRGCNKGDACKYRHILIGTTYAKKNRSYTKQSARASAQDGSVPEDKIMTRVCRYFKAGMCNKEETCTFLHIIE